MNIRMNGLTIRALNNLTARDKLALAVFFATALLCSLYFASGILVTYVSPPSNPFEMAKDGTGFTVRVLGLQSYHSAEQLSVALREQRRIDAVIEAVPSNQGYLVIIGPLARREAAEMLTDELHNSGYSVVKIIENCPTGKNCSPSGSGSRNSGQRKQIQ
jgi:hypothetical protein